MLNNKINNTIIFVLILIVIIVVEYFFLRYSFLKKIEKKRDYTTDKANTNTNKTRRASIKRSSKKIRS